MEMVSGIELSMRYNIGMISIPAYHSSDCCFIIRHIISAIHPILQKRYNNFREFYTAIRFGS